MTPELPQDGLTSAEAKARLAEHGPNEVPSAPPVPLRRRILAQLSDPMIMLLLGALVVVVVLGDSADAVIIAAVVVLNTAMGVVQEVRAENAIAALEQVSAPRTTALRDRRWEELSSRVVVVDDLVRLQAGDVVPADLRLVEAVSLEVDEASMTGESVPVHRTTGDELLSGTVVTRGRGRGVVVRTGAESGLGRIATLIARTRLRPTPLQRRLSTLSRQLVTVTAALSLLVMVLGIVRGTSVPDALILAVSLGVAAVPESLPAVVSVALAMGAHRMARRSALVRWLPAVETVQGRVCGAEQHGHVRHPPHSPAGAGKDSPPHEPGERWEARAATCPPRTRAHAPIPARPARVGQGRKARASRPGVRPQAPGAVRRAGRDTWKRAGTRVRDPGPARRGPCASVPRRSRDPGWQDDTRTGEYVGQMRTSPEMETHATGDEQAPPRLRVGPVATEGEPVPIARSEVPAMGEE